MQILNNMKYIVIYLLILLKLDVAFSELIRVPQEFYLNHIKIDQHPGFHPFISHVNFRHLADFAIDQSLEYFDPDWVKQGDSIYVNIWFLDWFEKYIHDQIKYPYLLITCDVGDRVPAHLGTLNKLLYDPKCAAWFARNMIFSYHSKLHQLPFGHDFWFWETSVERTILKEFETSLQNGPYKKKYLLYMNHYARKFGDRDKIVKLFENEPYCFSRNSSQKEYVILPRSVYYEDLGSSIFTISPIGLETDCVRNWEALSLDCIPIVEHTFLDPMYEGLSMVFVQDWEEINENFLLSKYQGQKGKSKEKTFSAYWEAQIIQCQNEIRNHDLSAAALESSKFDPQDLQDLSTILQNTKAMPLIYRGFLATLRPLELANSLNSRILFFDPWIDQATWYSLANYVTDFSIFKNRYNVFFLPEYLWDDTFRNYPNSSVFLDLTYYRHSLAFRAFSCRHSLKKDIEELYQQMGSGALLCGNMAKNEYVEKILDRLAKEHHWLIEKKGNIWFIVKSY